MKRVDLLNDIWSGANVVLASRSDLGLWPEIQALKTCPQDPEWHAEGDVFIHTDMVLAECAAIESDIIDIPNGPNILRMACLLHDIDKPSVTIYDEEYKHTIAPGHERMGGVTSRFLLRELTICNDDRRSISQLVATHHLLKRAVKGIDAPGGLAYLLRLAERVNTKLLWALELADMRGRISSTKEEQIEIVQLFKMLCEENNIFGKKPDPWIIESELNQINFVNNADIKKKYALSETHRKRLLGEMTSPYSALSLCHYQAIDQTIPPEVIITVGSAGSGKSTAIAQYAADYSIVSPDAVRKELYGNEAIQGDGEVQQICIERLKYSLRRSGSKVVYDATNVVPDLRSKIVSLCHDYEAYVILWIFDISKEELKRRNKQRQRQVPESVIDKQCDKFEWPLPEEAHEVRVFDEDT